MVERQYMVEDCTILSHQNTPLPVSVAAEGDKTTSRDPRLANIKERDRREEGKDKGRREGTGREK